MYEIKNRSIYEHEQFSMGVERQNLKWLYNANMDYVSEMCTVNRLDDLVAHGQLNGSVFKAKMLSPNRLKGLGTFGTAVVAYSNFTMLSLMLGPTAPAIGIVGLSIYGARAFSETMSISQIDYINEGEYAGQLRLKISKSPIMSYNIIAKPQAVRSVCALGNDDMGADDVEGNVVAVDQYFNEETGQVEKDSVFALPADAYRSTQALEWILAHKAPDSTTDENFSQLMREEHEATAATGGLTGLRALNATQTGYADMAREDAVNASLEDDAHTEQQLRELTELYGKEKLDEMKPGELYKLYKRHQLVGK